MSHEDDEAQRKRKDKERKERAVREREEKVKRERSRVEAELVRSRNALNREEGESEFLYAFHFQCSKNTSGFVALMLNCCFYCYTEPF